MKNIVKRILPKYVVSLIRNLILVKRLYPAYLYDLKRFYRYSGTDGHGDETKLIEKIITKIELLLRIKIKNRILNKRLFFSKKKFLQFLKHSFIRSI